MTIPARELKNRLGKYLKQVKEGHSVIVTDRGVPIAELRPVEVDRLSLEERMARMAEAGDVTLPTSRRFTASKPVRVRGRPVSATLLEDRD